MAMNGSQNQESLMVRVELGYCPRCGSLRARPAGAAEEFCTACLEFLAWVRSGCKRPLRRSARRPEATNGGRR
jgi:hypothetical protein